VLQCYSATVLQCYSVNSPDSAGYSATLQCYSSAAVLHLLQCYIATVLLVESAEARKLQASYVTTVLYSTRHRRDRASTVPQVLQCLSATGTFIVLASKQSLTVLQCRHRATVPLTCCGSIPSSSERRTNL
jgi:hypothetical protein